MLNLVFVTLLTGQVGLAQEFTRCAVAEPTIIDQVENEARDFVSQNWFLMATTPIQVYVHVIASSEESINEVSSAVVETQISVLNAAFSGKIGGAVTPFRFKLARISRTVNADWAHAGYDSVEEHQMKAALREGGPSDLNLYIPQLDSTILGWATFPWDQKGLMDGVVINPMSLPTSDSHAYSLGRTGVHEIGHWLGLYHTFQGGCSGEGDFVEDTASQRHPIFSCDDFMKNSCGIVDSRDPLENYMGYADDRCLTDFTSGQVNRMKAMWVLHRQYKKM